MASNKAIAATSEAIRQLFLGAAASPSAGDWSTTSIEIFQAEDLQHPTGGMNQQPRLSVYLYRVSLSTARRDRGLRVAEDGTTFLSSIPLDLHFLITAWSSQADTAQLLLGWAISVLNDTPVLPTSLLNAYQPSQPVFGPDETVEVVWDPMSLNDLYDVWQVATQRQAPSASYLARDVLIDSQVSVPVGPPVRERQFDYAKGPA